jgi:hypothetical protein
MDVTILPLDGLINVIIIIYINLETKYKINLC